MDSTDFGLQAPPFNLTTDTRFFYPNPVYEDVYKSLLSAIRQRRGLILLTGESGTGKTGLLRLLTNSLEETVRVVLFRSAPLTFNEMLTSLCDQLFLRVSSSDVVTIIQELRDSLHAWAQEGGITALLIDKAQDLNKDTLKGLDLFLKLEGPKGGKLLQIVLAGRPELDAKLAEPEFHHIQQGIAVRYWLPRLSEAEVGLFIQHRLRAVGCERQDLFAPEAIQSIARHSRAIPRLVNVICDKALSVVSATGQKTVSAAIIEEVVQNLRSNKKPEVSGDLEPVIREAVQAKARPRFPLALQHWAQLLAWTGRGMLFVGLLSLLLFVGLSLFKQASASWLVGVLPWAIGRAQVAISSLTERATAEPETAPLTQSPARPKRQSRKLTKSAETALSLEDARSPENRNQPLPQAPKVLKPDTRERSLKIAQRPKNKKRLVARQTVVAKQHRRRETARTQLVRMGIPVNKQALLNTVEEGDTRATDLLLRAGVSPNTKDTQGWTALIVAARKNLLDVVHTLITHGANVNARDKTGGTALMYAAGKGHRRTVETLLNKGADVNLKDKDGWTALMYATQRGDTTDQFQSNDSDTAAEESDEDYQAIVELLQQAGAEK